MRTASTRVLTWLSALAVLLSGCGTPGDLGRAADPAADPAAAVGTDGTGQGGAAGEALPAPDPADTAALADSVLVLHFLDVGQADAVLIRSPSGQAVLYDGGEGGAGGTGLAERLRRLGVERLDLVVASHNHADHIGALPEVIREFRPRFVIDNGIPHTTRTYERFLQAIEAAGSGLLEPERRTLRLGEVEIEIVPPAGRSSWGHNDNSVGVRVRHGEFQAIMLGDAEPRQFEWWLDRHPDLFGAVQVHKATHHGSRSGDTSEALARLRPEVVVVGVGAGNTYGHPHAEAMARYAGVGATVYRTDRDGSVTVEALRTGEYRVRTERGIPPADAAAAAGCIDVNRAEPRELSRLVHIDSARAAQILDLRRERRFASVRDLARVQGIGPARVADIAAQGRACVP